VPSDSGLGYLPNQDLALSPYHILTLPRGAQLTPECQALVEMASPPDSYEVYTTAISAAAVSTQIKAIESRLGLKARPRPCSHACTRRARRAGQPLGALRKRDVPGGLTGCFRAPRAMRMRTGPFLRSGSQPEHVRLGAMGARDSYVLKLL